MCHIISQTFERIFRIWHALGLFEKHDLAVGHKGILLAGCNQRRDISILAIDRKRIEIPFITGHHFLLERLDDAVDIIRLIPHEKIDRRKCAFADVGHYLPEVGYLRLYCHDDFDFLKKYP